MSIADRLTPVVGVESGGTVGTNSTTLRPDPSTVPNLVFRSGNATAGTTGNITHFIDEIISVPTGANIVVKRLMKNVSGTITAVSGIVVHPTPANTTALGTEVPPANVALGTLAVTADGEVHVRTGAPASEAWTVIGTQS
jgi:hypothetical protein